MRFAQDQASNVNIVRGYASGELRINDSVFRTSMLLAADALQAEAGLTNVGGLDDGQAARVMALKPEVVLVGTGPRQEFPAPSFSRQFLLAGIGVEVMSTGAACRTFNVLVGERRRVVALLIVPTDT